MVTSGLLALLGLLTPDDSVWHWLKIRYLTLKSLSGSFTETVRSEFDTTGQEFSGTFSCLLPSCYRIEVTAPKRQTIVGNDSVLWFYFPAEKRAVRQSGATAIPLLAFLEPMLDSSATAVLSVDSSGKRRLEVSTSEPGFAFSNYVFELDAAGQKITAFSFADAWGNAYRFRLSDQRWNPRLTAKLFQFTPPSGTAVDTIGP